MKIPGRNEWAGYKDVQGGRQGHSLWFGKSLDAMQESFAGGRSIQRGDELLHMPRPAFQFYIFAFAQYIKSEASIGDSDGASSFLRFLTGRAERDLASVAQIYDRLEPVIEFVAGSQSRFAAEPGIYGDFREQAALLAKLCGATPGQPKPDDEMLDPTDDA